MEETRLIGVYIKVNDNNEIVAICSDIFIDDVSNWLKIDEGEGDKYAHAQSLYFEKSLIDDNGNYNYRYENGKIISVVN